jgi:ABC-type Fe3+ transport system substrate-binding protein
VRVLESSMNAKYGIAIRVNVTGGPSMSELVTRTIQETQAKQTPSTDLIRVTPRQNFQLQGAGATEAVDWKAYEPAIQPQEMTADGSGLIVYADRVGIAYNTKIVSSAMAPKSVEDLSNAKYKGMIGTTPYGTGWGEAAMLFGSDRAWKWAQAMAPNVAGFTGSGNFGPVITGQLPIFAFTGTPSTAIRQKEKGAPIDMAYPFQAYELTSMTMLKGSPHPNASRLFALFLHTPEGQKTLWEYNREDSPFLETSHEYKQVQDARSAGDQVLLYTEADVLKHQDAFKKLVPAIDKMFQTY